MSVFKGLILKDSSCSKGTHSLDVLYFYGFHNFNSNNPVGYLKHNIKINETEM
jgi:hypothetical protein